MRPRGRYQRRPWRPGLRLREQVPVARGLEQRRKRRRSLHAEMTVTAARLEQADGRSARAQPIRQNAAGRAGTDDHVVVLGHRPLPSAVLCSAGADAPEASSAYCRIPRRARSWLRSSPLPRGLRFSCIAQVLRSDFSKTQARVVPSIVSRRLTHVKGGGGATGLVQQSTCAARRAPRLCPSTTNWILGLLGCSHPRSQAARPAA